MTINIQGRAKADSAAQARRAFALVQLAKAAVGAALGLAFFGLVGRPDAAELVALAGLVSPALLTLLTLSSISLARLEQIGLAGFAALIGYLALLTGGMGSPLLVWFALVPAEAALAGGPNDSRAAVVRAGLAAGAALIAVAGVQALGALPPSRLTLPAWEVYACSMLAALVQAVLIAAAAQDRQRAADAAAAEGAAMYRFLADNAAEIAAFEARRQAAFDEERADWQRRGEFDRVTDLADADAPVAGAVDVPDGADLVEAPFGGSVWKLLVAEGDEVKAGDTIAVLEAMKMECAVESPGSGVVAALYMQEKQALQPGAPMLALRRHAA